MRNKLIGKIHVLKNKANLDEEVYRLTLLRVTGKESCKELSIAELEAVLQDFERLGINNKPHHKPTVTKGQFKYVTTKCSKLRKILKMWVELAEIGEMRDSTNAGLNRFLEHKFNTSVDNLNNTHIAYSSTKDKIIEALKHMSERAIKKIAN